MHKALWQWLWLWLWQKNKIQIRSFKFSQNFSVESYTSGSYKRRLRVTLKLSRWVQIGPNWSKLAQIDPKYCSKLVFFFSKFWTSELPNPLFYRTRPKSQNIPIFQQSKNLLTSMFLKMNYHPAKRKTIVSWIIPEK